MLLLDQKLYVHASKRKDTRTRDALVKQLKADTHWQSKMSTNLPY